MLRSSFSYKRRSRYLFLGTLTLLWVVAAIGFAASVSAELQAGAAKADITFPGEPFNDRLHARALVLKNDATAIVVISLDVVSLGEIGYIGNDFEASVRSQIQRELGIPVANIIINTSHCHGKPAKDSDQRTLRAVREAARKLQPVKIGIGTGHEDRIQQNRRLILENGKEIDERRAYSLPPDEQVVDVGPIDPEIGVVRVDDLEGVPVAVIYNFAMHPIMGTPNGWNTADVTGFSSSVIENNLGNGAVALFLQGCGGDINPADYKNIDAPRHAEPAGNILGLSTLKAIRRIETRADDRLVVVNEVIELPRANLAERIQQMESERQRLLNSISGTTLNLRTFLDLTIRHRLSPDYPSNFKYRYLADEKINNNDQALHDSLNRRLLKQYARNIYTMEHLSRLNTNLQLLKQHQRRNLAAKKRTIDAEVTAIRLGDMAMVTFPGEATVRIGLSIKQKSPHERTFIAAYTNGYLYYAPTDQQLRNNVGGAQEDSDCLLAPGWQEIYEAKALQMLRQLDVK